jgi:hypothetical protein
MLTRRCLSTLTSPSLSTTSTTSTTPRTLFSPSTLYTARSSLLFPSRSTTPTAARFSSSSSSAPKKSTSQQPLPQPSQRLELFPSSLSLRTSSPPASSSTSTLPPRSSSSPSPRSSTSGPSPRLSSKRPLTALQTSQPSVGSHRLLGRDFIHDSLYHPDYGYFSKHAVIFSPPQPIHFPSLQSSLEFTDAIAQMYLQYDEVEEDDALQVWHTPTEMFKVYTR